MFVKGGVMLACFGLLILAIFSYALMGLAEEASPTLTWFDRLVGMICCGGFASVGYYLVWRLWPHRCVEAATRPRQAAA